MQKHRYFTRLQKRAQERREFLRWNHNGIYACSMAGNRTNQDRVVLSDYTVGVLDGHGQHGDVVAQAVLDSIESHQTDFSSFDIATLTKTIENIPDNEDEKLNKNGTTLCLALHTENELVTINVGDSKVMLISRCPQTQEWSTKWLTNDHSYDNKDEQKRVIDQGGRFVRTLFGNKKALCAPDGGWLAMTRAIGDYDLRPVGLIKTPEIRSHQIRDCDMFALVMTDGVSDYLTGNMVTSIMEETEKTRNLYSKVNREDIADILCNMAITYASCTNRRIDDASIVVIRLAPPADD